MKVASPVKCLFRAIICSLYKACGLGFVDDGCLMVCASQGPNGTLHPHCNEPACELLRFYLVTVCWNGCNWSKTAENGKTLHPPNPQGTVHQENRNRSDFGEPKFKTNTVVSACSNQTCQGRRHPCGLHARWLTMHCACKSSFCCIVCALWISLVLFWCPPVMLTVAATFCNKGYPKM